MLNYNRVRRVLSTWGNKFSEKLKNYLRNDGFKATGETIASIKPRVSKKGETLNLQFESKANTGKKGTYTISDIINRGRKPQVDNPPPYKSIEQWIMAKGVTLKDYKTGRFIKKDALNVKRAAIAISKSIDRKGTIERKGNTGANMYQSLFVPEQETMKLEIANAYEQDVRAYMKRQNKNIK